MTELTPTRREVLAAFCDTVVPPVERGDDPDGFWARKATDLGVDAGVAELIAGIPDPALRGGLLQLVDALLDQGFTTAPSQASREQILRNLCMASPDAAQGVGALTQMTLFLYYGAPDPATGKNPNWTTFGFPGPAAPPQNVPKAIQPLAPEAATTLEADVCVVGSGAGGGTIAGTVAKRGLKVVVLEAAGYFNESDFLGLELPAYQSMFWRGGPTPTADGNVSLQAGTTLGGGTTINWMNCLRTKPWVREEWAREFGLEGVDGPDFDRHLDAVLERIGANDRCSDLNGPHQRMKEGCESLGWSFKTIVRNADASTYSPDSAGFLGWGDSSGSKQSTEKTFLRDAVASDAEVLVSCRAQRILVENGRAVGVEAVYTRASGEQVPVTVRAKHVVVACGALESPALLMRSGIGGPAVGNYLRLHPALAMLGIYREDQRAWWGAPQTALCDEFVDVEDHHGYLIEGAQYAPGLASSALPWVGGAAHKELMSQFRIGASLIALIRDRGHGRVTVDANGEAVPWYAVEDELDARNLRRSIASLAELHQAAGADAMYALAAKMPEWRRGDDLGAFLARCDRLPLGVGGIRLFSAHQMGTCRMGTDPQTSVAGPWGELHDVKGVWIGDGSAFPTPSGTNPMISIMALAHRTAEALADAAGARSEPALETARG
jgi:choline dehydrogenase-like flavoprotein